jgi:di/tricarboxylate transporter
VVYGPWERLRAVSSGKDFIIVTPLEEGGARSSKAAIAIACFAGGIGLTLSGVQLSLGLLTGAIGMVLFGVVSIQEAYRSIDWRTVFLLAGLIPLGIAMENTGAAAFLANGLMELVGGTHPLVILTGIAVLATFFSLFMSNIAATVILVPLVLIIGADTGIDPRGLALLVAVCASNSFVLPTHQVNAFIMGPGGYRNHDFLKAGGIMTVLFIAVAVTCVYLLFV